MQRDVRRLPLITLAVGVAWALAGCHGSSGMRTPGTAGAAGGEGGGAGAGAGTAGGGGSVATNPCATALFCDDFETYTAGQAPGGSWTQNVNGGTVAVDTTQFHSGTKSVKFTTAAQANTKTAMIRLAATSVFPVSGDMFYGRIMFRLAAAPTASVHWTLIQSAGVVPGQTYHAVYRYGGQLPVMNGSTFVGSQLMANYDTPDSYGNKNTPGSDCWLHANQVVVPVATWSCAEWQFDGSTNQMRFWLDGTAVDSLTMTGTGQGCVNAAANYTWTAPTFDHLDLGWESYQTDDARTLWIDDVVVSKTKIGCP